MASCSMSMMSVARWQDRRLTSYLHNCGLQQHILQVDAHTSIACWSRPSQEADLQKPALLLIHGFGASAAWQWAKQVKPLLPDFRLFLPDLVFFGKSSTVSPHRSEVFQAQMVAMAMEAMGVHTYGVVGISYGSCVAYRLAHLFPDRVEKVVLVSAGICMTSKDHKELLERAHVDATSDFLLPRSPASLRTLLRLSMHKTFNFVPSCLLRDAIQYFYVKNRKELAELLANSFIEMHERESLPALSQKVLIIWGEYDGIFPLAMAYRLKELLKDNAELAIMKNVSHAVQLEKPREFTRLLQNFFLAQDARESRNGK